MRWHKVHEAEAWNPPSGTLEVCAKLDIRTNPAVVWQRVQLVTPPCWAPWQRTHAVPEPVQLSLA